MRAIICGTGGRAPPAQNKRSPAGSNQWRLHWRTLLQDLVGCSQLAVLALQLLEARFVLGGGTGTPACLTGRLDAPGSQGLMRTTELRSDRAIGRVVARVIRPRLAIQTNAALAELGRVLRGGLLRRFDKGHPSRVLLSRKPGALQCALSAGSASLLRCVARVSRTITVRCEIGSNKRSAPVLDSGTKPGSSTISGLTPAS